MNQPHAVDQDVEKRYFSAFFWTSGEGLDGHQFFFTLNLYSMLEAFLSSSVSLSMCRHMFNLIIVGCDAKQPIPVKDVGAAVGLPRIMLFGVEEPCGLGARPWVQYLLQSACQSMCRQPMRVLLSYYGVLLNPPLRS